MLNGTNAIMKKTRNIIILGPNSFSFLNFRYDLINKLQNKYNIYLIGNINPKHINKFKRLNVKLINTRINNAKIEVLKDFLIFFKILRLLSKIKPKFIISYTIKSNLISGILSYFFFKRIFFFSFITGLGNIYLSCKNSTLKTKVYFLFYKIILKNFKLIFFQNHEDLKIFKKQNVVNNNAILSYLTGVNTNNLRPHKQPDGINFLMISRIIKNKGVYEYLLAANSIKKKYKNVNFYFAGKFDNSSYSLDKIKFKKLIKLNVVNLGWIENVKNVIKKCNIIVLPSYREGLPRSILEGMSMGKAVLVTDVAGCKETVKKNYNGFLVKARNYKSLLFGMEKFIKNKKIISMYGKRSRTLTLKKFDSKKLALDVIKSIEKCVEYQA